MRLPSVVLLCLHLDRPRQVRNEFSYFSIESVPRKAKRLGQLCLQRVQQGTVGPCYDKGSRYQHLIPETHDDV